MKLKQITQAELKEFRYKQWLKQNKICPILKQEIEYSDAVADHKHKTKAEVLGEDGKGLLRGVIHRNVNVVEGKIARMYRRYGIHKLNISLPTLLRNLADYLENPPLEQRYIHPNEKPKAKKIGKRDFNKIIKYYFKIYPNRKKLPEYPKSGKITKNLEKLLKNINNIV